MGIAGTPGFAKVKNQLCALDGIGGLSIYRHADVGFISNCLLQSFSISRPVFEINAKVKNDSF